MAKVKDIFGFDELEKSFKKMETKYPNEADAFLMMMGRAANSRTKQLTPTKTKKLRNSWRLKKVKLYKGGKVRVVRVQSEANHAHLVNDGHNVYTTGGRKGKVKRYNAIQRSIRGIKSHGRVEGVKMLENAIKETQNQYYAKADKLMDKLTKEVQV